jgi:hypothetical protein
MSEKFDSRAPTLDPRRSLDAEKQNIEISVEEQPSKGVQSWDPTKLPWVCDSRPLIYIDGQPAIIGYYNN